MSVENMLPSFVHEKLAQGHCVLIALVGAGGKTSTVAALARYFARQGKRVLVATSTKTCLKEGQRQKKLLLADNASSLEHSLREAWQEHGIVSVAARIASEQGKVVGLTKEHITVLQQARLADVILCEADGAARKALKAPAAHEPVIPEGTDFCLGIIGLDILYGQNGGAAPLTDAYVHRAEIFSDLTGLALGEPLTFAAMVSLAEHGQGLFKGSAKIAQMPQTKYGVQKMQTDSVARAVFLNKFDVLPPHHTEAILRTWRRYLQENAVQMPWWYGSTLQDDVHLLV